METREELFYQFFQEFIESYRQEILQQKDAKILMEKQKDLSIRVQEEFRGPYSKEYRLITDLIGCIHDLDCIKQEQLYIQGVKDGIRLKRRIEKIEEGEAC